MKFKFLFLQLLFLAPLFLYSFVLAANTPEALKSAIEAKNQALQDINQQIQKTQKDLDAVQGQGKTLQNQIKSIDYQLNQVNLGIRSSELTIDKLNLEINSLQGSIKETNSSIETQKSGIATILEEINKKDNETILLTLLKNKNLSDSLSELQSLSNLNIGLSASVDKFQELNDKLSDNLNSTAQKRKGIVSENQNLKTKKSLAVSEKNDRQNLLSQTKNQEKIYQNLITDLEKQQNSISDEISQIEDQLRASFDPNLLPIKRPGVFSWPIKLAKDGGTAYVTQHFGEKAYLYRGKAHNGLDIGSPIGTPVFAAADGKVIAVDNNDKSSWAKYQYGKYVLIQHDNNLITIYAHLSSQIAKKNSLVKRGDLIGYVGKTGYATGPHLHFGVYWAPSVLLKSIPPAAGLVPIGVVINPEDYL